MNPFNVNFKFNVKQNWVDKTVSYFKPQAGLKRLEARAKLAFIGGYTGARRNRRQTQSWNVTSGSADSETLPDLPELRARSRDLVRNAPLATGAINTVVTNVVGSGLKVQSRIDRELLQPYLKTPEDADKFERHAERVFKLWGNSLECDITGTQHFSQLQSLVLRSCLESGDIFVVKRYNKVKSALVGLSLQLVEADRVHNPSAKPDNPTLAGGVEMNSLGAPIAYYVGNGYQHDFQNPETSITRIPALGKDGSRQVFHIFSKVRPGLTRGVPYLAPVIESLKQIDRYTEAEIMSAVISSMFTIFVTSECEEGLAPPVTDPNDTGNASRDSNYNIAPGAILDLQPNEKIEIADPKRPNQAFDPFIQAILRQVGVALEIPFEILIKHFTASYSAAQAALVEAWKFFSSRRTWLAERFCQPVYELVIAEAVAKGLLKAPGFFSNPMIRAAYLNADWIGPPRGQIDQLKEIKAAQTRIELGVSTLSEETSLLTGGDWERKHPQSVKEHDMRVEAGLIAPATTTSNQVNNTVKQDLSD